MGAEILKTSETATKIAALEKQIVECSMLEEEPHDVVGANRFFSQLPELKQAGDKTSLHREASGIVNRAAMLDIDTCTEEDLIIAFGDAAMAVTACVLPAENPSESPDVDDVLPDAGDVLVRLAGALGLPPRNTDGNYPGFHPRRFTKRKVPIGESEAYAEDVFKVVVAEGLRTQAELIQDMVEATGYEVDSPAFAEIMRRAKEHFSSMTIANVVARKYLPKDYFSLELMPFFMPYKVKGKEYIHSGSQMNHVLLLDHALWGFENEDPDYQLYRERNLAYASEAQQEDFIRVTHNLEDRGSLVNVMLGSLPADPYNATPAQLESVTAMVGLIDEMVKFRSVHLANLKDSGKYRSNGESTGGAADMPAYLLEQTNLQRTHLDRYVREHKRRLGNGNGLTSQFESATT